MIEATVLIVGGGPAGSACAAELHHAGISAGILDKALFPRAKLCAGWITPSVFRLLGISSDDYPHGLINVDRLVCHFKGRPVIIRTRQFSIRRLEFDHWLLNRARVPVHHHRVKTIREEDRRYIIDNQFRSKYLVGAGGTFCPVYKHLFSRVRPRPKTSLISTAEAEIPHPALDSDCRLWFFENRLPGYAWYVPKTDGMLNVGIGGKFEAMKKRGRPIGLHWQDFIRKLRNRGLVTSDTPSPRGHPYYLKHLTGPVRLKNAFLTGDAAGLATLDMGEGIGPAIQSGIRAARAIIEQKSYRLSPLPALSFLRILMPRLPV